MTAPAIDSRAHATSIKAALSTVIPNVYEYGEVPGSNGSQGSPPNIYVLVAVERRFVDAALLTARASRSSWRVSVRSVGRTIAEARWADSQAATVLGDLRLNVSGLLSTPVAHESSTAPEYDDGRMSGSSTFTYTC